MYVIMQEKLERVSTPLFGGLVRCSAHGRSFARLQYYFPKAIKLQNCVATIQRCQPFKDVQLHLCDYCTILLVYTRLGHKTTIMQMLKDYLQYSCMFPYLSGGGPPPPPPPPPCTATSPTSIASTDWSLSTIAKLYLQNMAVL